MTSKRIVSVLFIFSAFIFLTACSGDAQPKKQNVVNKQLYTCPMHPEIITDQPGQCPKCGMDLVPVKQTEPENMPGNKKPAKRKIIYWQAPMDPTEIYDHPGKSKMGMDLVPVYEDEQSASSAIKIDPVTVQNMGVRLAEVKRSDFRRTIRSVASVDYNEKTIYDVSARINGWIEKLYVSSTGQPVKKGQALLEIYSPELVTTQQEYLLALKNERLAGQSPFASIRNSARSLLAASRQRLLNWNIPQSAVKTLEQTQKVRNTLTLESPANGIVLHKNALQGMHVKEGLSLYKIADLSTVWVYASIYDDEAPWLKVGQKAELQLSYLPGKTFSGSISYIYPYLDKKARDLKVRLEFSNPGLRLKPGMYANVNITANPIANALVIPEEAVIHSGKRNLVFISKGEGRFEPRSVRLGEENGTGRVRVLAGLQAGEKIVVSAQFLIDSESRLQEAVRKMLAEKTKN